MNPSLKVAQPGWDCRTCPDYELVFNSDWPSLTIAYERTITIASGNNYVYHNLGFVPLPSVWVTVSGANYGRVPNLTVSSTYVLIQSGLVPTGATVTVRCYNIDITQEASYPLPQSAAFRQAPDYTTFVRVAKADRSINSSNLNDFVVNSLAQAPAVLDVVTQAGQYFKLTGSGPEITYPLQTSFIPWMLWMFGTSAGVYQCGNPIGLVYNNATNTITISFGSSSIAASLIVLRDPLIYPNTVRVVY